MGSGGRRVCEQDSISGNDSEEVDDIELIFTNDDTKELTGFQVMPNYDFVYIYMYLCTILLVPFRIL